MGKKQSNHGAKPPLVQDATYECGFGKGFVTVSTGVCTKRFKPKKVHMCKDGHPCSRPEEIAKLA